MASGETGHVTGKYTGNGTSQDIALSFAPKIVVVMNVTDNIIAIKSKQQANGKHTQIAAAGTISQIATGGISIPDQQPVPAPAGDSWKFSVGDNAGVNAADKECLFMAWE